MFLNRPRDTTAQARASSRACPSDRSTKYPTQRCPRRAFRGEALRAGEAVASNDCDSPRRSTAMTRLLMGEPDLWWAYHSKIEYPANHRCRIAGFEPAVSRAGDVRQGGGGANPRRATCSTSLPLANLAPAARRPSRCCFCLFHSTIVASFLDRLAGIACSDGERLQDQVRDRIRV
jgi:hypothetical protein